MHVKFSMERIAVIWSKKVIKCECWIGLPQTQCWVDPGGGPLPLPKGVATRCGQGLTARTMNNDLPPSWKW